MKKGKIKKLTAAALSIAMAFAAYPFTSVRADSAEIIPALSSAVPENSSDSETYVYEQVSDEEASETCTLLEESAPESSEDTSEESSETENSPSVTDEETTPESVSEETPDTGSETVPSEPPESEEPSVTPPPQFHVPTEPASTAPPIVIILLGPGYVFTESHSDNPSETASAETTVPVSEQTAPPLAEPTVNKLILTSDDAPAAEILTEKEELIKAVFDPFERASLLYGGEVNVILSIGGESAVSGHDRELISAAADSGSFGGKYCLGEYFDMSLTKSIFDSDTDISELYAEITLKLDIPENIRYSSKKYALIGVHGGTAVLLEDLDSDPDTITVKTDRFSSYAIVYTENDDVNIKTANKLDCLKIFLSVTSAAVLFCSAALLYEMWSKKSGRSDKKTD